MSDLLEELVWFHSRDLARVSALFIMEEISIFVWNAISLGGHCLGTGHKLIQRKDNEDSS